MMACTERMKIFRFFFFLQTVTFVDQCTWADSLVELQLWCRLGIIANRANDVDTTFYCRDKTLELITRFQTRKVEK